MLCVHQGEGQGKWGDPLSSRYVPVLSSYIFNNIINSILAQDSQGYPGVHAGLLAAVMLSATIPGEQRQVVLLDV